MINIFQTIGKVFVTGAIAIASLFGYQAQPIENVGATIPVVVAVFQTSLQSSITATATSMTLVSGTNKAGNTLSGYTCFNIDEGTAIEEFVCGTVSGTAVTSMIRGIDPIDGDLEVTALKKAHRRGASVKITNYPSLAINSRILNGNETLPNPISYASGVGPLASSDLADKEYVLSVVSGGSVSFEKVVISGTAGETLSAGNVVYLKASDGRWWKADADLSSTLDNVQLGIAQGSGTAGNAISSGVLIKGTDTNQSGGSAGATGYISNTAGGISTSTGTITKVVGNFLTATTFQFDPYFNGLPTTFASDAGSNDSYAITLPSVYGAYRTGMIAQFYANTANTGSATLNINSLGAKTLKKNVSDDLVTGDILAGQMVLVIYDGTYFQVLSKTPLQAPIVNLYDTVSSPTGDYTTQFDVTNPSGTTYRYTYDTTGTDPSINSGTFPIGTAVDIQAENLASGNKGFFIVTGVGSNYIEVTNASGVVESNKTIAKGYINKGTVWTKPAGLKYITLEVQGAGGGGSGINGGGSSYATASGGAGGYSKKSILASALGSTENYVIGFGGNAATTGSTATYHGARTIFGSSLAVTGNGGKSAITTSQAGLGGTASGGDINISGGNGIYGSTAGPNSGGSSFLGRGGLVQEVTSDHDGVNGGLYGAGGSGAVITGTGTQVGSIGAKGCIIITEYY